ncbi:Hypothetical protein CINCED_3A011272, partial [Cinara cedri]
MCDLECWNKIWIDEDLTAKKLFDLKRSSDGGDHNWVIRYFNGSPRVVKKKISNGSSKKRVTCRGC